MSTTRYLSVKEAADVLNIEVSSVRRAITQERLGAIRRPTFTNRYGYYYEVPEHEVERYRREPRPKANGRTGNGKGRRRARERRAAE